LWRGETKGSRRQSDFLAEPPQQILESLGLAQAVQVAVGLILLTVGESGVDRLLQIAEVFFFLPGQPAKLSRRSSRSSTTENPTHRTNRNASG
jgi:hypothetical protein